MMVCSFYLGRRHLWQVVGRGEGRSRVFVSIALSLAVFYGGGKFLFGMLLCRGVIALPCSVGRWPY